MKSKIYLFLLLVFAGMIGGYGLKAQPVFSGGGTQTMSVCQNSAATDISAMLSVVDPSTTDTLTWAAEGAPSNGILVASYSALGNGGLVTPVGLTYMPNSGYNGSDSFSVMVTDGVSGDTTTTIVYVTVNPLPNVYSVSGGGAYCQGGTGVDIVLSSSDLSVSYQIYSGSTAGATMSGTGSPIDFASVTDTGTHTIVGTTVPAGCMAIMTGSAMVTINPVPAPISGTPVVCVGAVTNLTDDSLSGTWSSSDNSLATVDGSGHVSGIAAGSPVIDYTLATGCMASVAVLVNPLPTVYNVTGGGSYCAGSPTVYDISLANSDAGFSYQLYNGSTAVGLPMGGGSSPLDFGTTSATGVYTIVSTNNSTSCQAYMSGSASIISNPLPAIDTVTGGGSYCSGPTGTHIGLNTSSIGVNYQLFHHSVLVGSAITGTGSAIDFGAFTDSGSYMAYAINTSTFCASNMADSAVVSVLPLPSVYSITGGGSYCAGGAGVAVGLTGSNTGVNYVLYYGSSILDTVSGSGASIDFGSQTSEGSYSIVAINSGTGCRNNMTGSAAVIINPLPAVYNVMGGGSYCAGGVGVDISLNASNTGIIYQLYKGVTALDAPLGGIGAALDFGNQTDSGTYTIIAIDTTHPTFCIRTMSGNPVITINPLPIVYTITGGGGYCAGGSGMPVSMDLTQTGMLYKLYHGSTLIDSLPGSGGALSFGSEATPGNYIATATNMTTGCEAPMSGIAAVSVLPAPSLHVVTGGGGYCAGGTGASIGLNGSNNGVEYQLYHWSVATGLPMGGTGASFSFGLDTAAGVYKVMATDTATHCTAMMTDSATVTINPLLSPMVTVSASTHDTICNGTSVTFTAAPHSGGTSPTYQWMVNGFNVGSGLSTYSYVPANGDVIGVMLASSEACVVYDTAADSMMMNVWPNGTPMAVIAPDMTTVCKGSFVTFSVADTFQGPSPSFIWEVNSVSAGTGSIFTYAPHNGDIVYVGMISDYLCRLTTLVVSNNVTLTVDSPIAPIVTINANPGAYVAKGAYDTLTASVTQGGSAPLYQWYSGATPISGATTATYFARFTARDSVSCRVTRNDACMTTSFNGIVINVDPTGVSNVNMSGEISVFPNPNNGSFTIKGTTGSGIDEAVSFEITDMIGQAVYKGNAIVKDGMINEQIAITSLASGNYLLNVHSSAGNSVMHFVVAQ